MPRRRPPPQRQRQPPTVATIHSLGDDLLGEIFLRLPSLPSLVRAALTCRAFLAVIRPSTFRRRFRALHPPPLLGFFSKVMGHQDVPHFSPVRRSSDPDIAAAVRGMDVFFTRLPYHEDAFQGWSIAECRDGRLLLLTVTTEQMAVYNPLTGALDLFPEPLHDMSSGSRGKTLHQSNLLYSVESPGSFRVIAMCHDESRMRAAVFSSDTREWQILPWSSTYPAQPSGKEHWLMYGVQVNGKLYWAHTEQAYIVVLDTATLQFSCIDLLDHLKGRNHLYKLGSTKDGRLCIVCVVGFALLTWIWRADASGAGEWMFHSVIPLEGEILQVTNIPQDKLYEHGLEVLQVLDGTVYMWIDGQDFLPLFLSFGLETRKLEKLFQRKFDHRVRPYIMGWPSFLMGNDLDMALDSGVQSNVHKQGRPDGSDNMMAIV